MGNGGSQETLPGDEDSHSAEEQSVSPKPKMLVTLLPRLCVCVAVGTHFNCGKPKAPAVIH